jgi:predicted DCC family thiol-disulfide oxidoreductase YuxK
MTEVEECHTPQLHSPSTEVRYWLFWDGDCGFCRRGVAWVKEQDKAEKIDAVPYQEAPRPPMTDALAARCVRAVHVITPSGQILSGGRACLCVVSVIGYRRLARVLCLPPLVWLVEAGYWLVARNRRFFSRFLFRPPSHSS